MKSRKILAIVIAMAMVFSAIVIINKIADEKLSFLETAGAATMGVDDFQGSPSGADILNMSDGTESLIFGETVSVKFNGSLINEACAIYKPRYMTGYGDGSTSGSGKWDLWVNFTQDTIMTGWNDDEPTQSLTFDIAGLWLVVSDIDPLELITYNMSSMKAYDSGDSSWENIVGWFWVNGSSWTVTLNKDTVYYDRNDSIIITVTDEDGDPVTGTFWIDIWNVSGKTNYDKHTLVYHDKVTLNSGDDGKVTISNLYSYTHLKGAGTYRVTAYKDDHPDYTDAQWMSNSYAFRIFGEEGDESYDAWYGYNDTFGNTSIWSSRFIDSGTTTLIRDCTNDLVDTADWNDTTYKWDTCGPFNPPEYWADYVNFTVAPGVPTLTVTNGSQFWNDTNDMEVKVTVHDYDDNNITASGITVALYNKTNKPSKKTSKPISTDNYNISTDGADIKITPNNKASGQNRWGVNTTANPNYIWAPKGTIYVLVTWDSLGNDSEEWNGTAEFELVKAQNQFKWVDDDGNPTNVPWPSDNDDSDGVMPNVPRYDDCPLWIQFKVISSDYYYFGSANSGGCADVTECAENITITGNSLFTGTLDTFPNFATSWYERDNTNTWSVPIIPTMSVGGGEITIKVRAWNKSIIGELAIGETTYWTDGSIVSVSPNEFKISEADQILDITVKDAKGNKNPYANAYLCYIDTSTAATYTVDYTNRLNSANAITADGSGKYTWNFNTTQQTTNQTNTWASIGAPRNLTVYVTATNAGFGYALIRMNPMNDMQIELSDNTILAGQVYDDFTIDVTLVGTNGSSPSSDDKADFHIKILDEKENDVTDTLLNGIDSSDLTNDADYSWSFDNVYATEPGTYTFYAYNNTHDSAGYNATFYVEQVTVTPDKTPLIWMSDDNISVTFTITYNGEPVNGSLVIDNLTSASGDDGDYNMTWANCSFDGSTDPGGNDSTEILEDEIINGIVTVNDITANYLDSGEAEQYITFWFAPTNADGDSGEYAQALGELPVSVPTVKFASEDSSGKTYVAVGKTTTLTATIYGRGTDTIADIYMRLHGRGVDQNGTSDEDGQVVFAVIPTSTGDIEIDIGEEDRTIDKVVTVTAWMLDVSVSPTSVDEGEEFTVKVLKEGTTTPVSGATVKITGIGSGTTDSNGEVTFDAPDDISMDRTYTITVSKTGYTADDDVIQITVVNVPQLIISVDSSVSGGEKFQIVIAKDTGDPVIGATITFNGKTYTTKAGGVVTITAPDKKGTYEITATFGNFKSAKITITIKEGEAGTPGFELLTLIAALGVAFILLRRRRRQ